MNNSADRCSNTRDDSEGSRKVGNDEDRQTLLRTLSHTNFFETGVVIKARQKMFLSFPHEKYYIELYSALTSMKAFEAELGFR